jgi:hypothetical protein
MTERSFTRAPWGEQCDICDATAYRCIRVLALTSVGGSATVPNICERCLALMLRDATSSQFTD